MLIESDRFLKVMSFDSDLCCCLIVVCLFREEQYRQVWAELDTFLEAASRTSKMHEKVTIYNCMHCQLSLKRTLLDYRYDFEIGSSFTLKAMILFC